MTHLNTWPPQDNGCPVKQPCDSGCIRCDHFKAGDRVVSIAGQQVGYRGVLLESYMDNNFHLFMVRWGRNSHTVGKYVQHYKLLYDDNDIEFYQRDRD